MFLFFFKRSHALIHSPSTNIRDLISFIHAKHLKHFYHITKCASSSRVAFSIQSPLGMLRVPWVLAGQVSMHSKLCTHRRGCLLLMLANSSWKVMHFLEYSRTISLHFCLLLRHNAVLKAKNCPKDYRKHKTSKMESGYSGFKVKNKAKLNRL